MKTIDFSFITSIYHKRKSNSHKGNFGHALLIAGSQQKMGAAIIATKACLKSGVGLVTTLIPKSERNTIFSTIPEAMVYFREDAIDFSNYNTIGIGPGLNLDESAQKLVYSVLTKVTFPVVFDADALNILANNQDLLLQLPKDSILTPHPKEFDRLFGLHSSDEERRKTAEIQAKTLQCVIVLKGHKTGITDGNISFENTTGNAGLAKGGSGDALTGIITALLAQNYTSIQAAILGVFIHGLAADITLKSQSEESMLITDVIENLGKAFQTIQSKIE